MTGERGVTNQPGQQPEAAVRGATTLTVRRVLVLVAASGLLAAALVAGWRSAHQPVEPGDRLAAQLRCPSCQGESVAASRSAIAAAMREVIADQLAAGRSPEQVRAWFVERYGPAVLDRPANRGPGLLLWVVPALAFAVAVRLAARARRRVRAEHDPPGWDTSTAGQPPSRPVRAHRLWDVIALCLVGLVAVVAMTGPPAAGRTTGEPRTPAEILASQLALAQELEQQGNFAAAAEVYAGVAGVQPADPIRLRQAYALLRVGTPEPAAAIARQVLAAAPGNPDALLLLGLAQRAAGSTEATETLRRFVRLAPNHPAAAEIGRVLATAPP